MRDAAPWRGRLRTSDSAAIGVLVASPAGAQAQDAGAGQPPAGALPRRGAPAVRLLTGALGGARRERCGDRPQRGHGVGGGCGLLERWQGVRGGTGVSVNTFDVARGDWTQRWGDGATLCLEGGLAGGRMELTGVDARPTPDGPVLDRLSWTPLAEGRVRQVWEVSRDGGASWQEVFSGLYVPVGPGSPRSDAGPGGSASLVGKAGKAGLLSSLPGSH